jgi:hypothetical protein
VAWAEDSNGVIAEVADHGVTFTAPADPAMAGWTSFIAVPVETYSNNVGFYGQLFTLVEEPVTAEVSAVSLDDEVALEVLGLEIFGIDVFPEIALRHRLNTVRASLQATGGNVKHIVTRFSDGDPEVQGNVFDINIIPRIVSDMVVNTSAPYQPDSCGVHEIIVEAIPGQHGVATATGSVLVDVTTDAVHDTTLLMQSVGALGLPHGTANSLKAQLRAANKSFQKGNMGAGTNQLGAFINAVLAQSGNKIPFDQAMNLVNQAEGIQDCLFYAPVQ